MAALEVFADLAQTTVSSGGTTAPSPGTVQSWTVASSASFPAVDTGATVFHVRDPANAGELIAVTAVSGTTWTVTRGANSTTPVAHSAGFTVIQVVTAGALQAMQYKPWQFPVEAYGAVGDGKIGTGGTGTSGSPTFTDAGASFVNAAAPVGDVGKYIIVNQGAEGAFQNPFCGTIIGVNSATSVTLSGNLAANAASAPYIYGTDDAPAITAAVNAAAAYATAAAGPYQAQVIFGAKNYMLGTLTQVHGTGTTTGYNTHIPVPVGPQAGQKLVIDLVGTGTGMDAGNAQWPFTTVPNLHGTCLVSAVFATGQPDGTYGQLSVIGGPTYIGIGPLANTVLVVDGITVVAPWNSPTDGVNGLLLTQMNVPDGAYLGFAPINGDDVTVGGPSYQANGAISAGSHAFVFPAFLNNDSNNVGLISVQGAGVGVNLTEHFTAQKLNLIYCNYAAAVIGISATYHGATIMQLSSEGSNFILHSQGTSGRFPIWIGLMDSEFISSQQIDDPGNFLGGVIYWATADSNAHFPDVTGGQNLAVIDVTHNGPGPWSGAPSAPSSGGASSNTQQNTAYRYATIYASASTSITNVWTGAPSVSSGLTATGLAAGANVVVPVRVAPGAYWAVAFTGTLTAKWVLD